MLLPEDVVVVVVVEEGGPYPTAMMAMTAVGEVEGCCCTIQVRPPVVFGSTKLRWC